MLSFMLDLVFGILLGGRRLPIKHLLPLAAGAGAMTGVVFDVVIPVLFSSFAGLGIAVAAIIGSAVIHGAVVFVVAYFVGRRASRGFGD